MSVKKKIAILLVGCCMVASVTEANAQGLFGGKTFGQRLDDFGRTVFGTNTPSERDTTGDRPNTKVVVIKGDPNDPPADTSTNRAGSNMRQAGSTPKNTNNGTSTIRQPSEIGDRYNTIAPPPAIPSSATPVPRQAVSRNDLRAVPQEPKVAEVEQVPSAAPVADFGPPPSKPIQNRLMQSRTSAFSNNQKQPASAATQLGAPNPNSPSNTAYSSNQTQPAAGANPAKGPSQPTLARRPGVSDRPEPVSVAERMSPANVRPKSEDSLGKNPLQSDAVSELSPATVSQTRAKDDGLMITRRGPVLSVETLGPRKIIVGKESTYEVVVSNSGEVAAEEVVVFVSLPEWAEVSGAESSRGTPQFTAPGQSKAPFQWKVGHLDARNKEKLALRIIPRQSKAFDLAVRWDYKPVASQAMIEVQEPKLEMHLEGPREVFYGKKETYRLKMTNGGTGNAEGVVVKLMPTGPGENVPAVYQLGVLPAGEEKNIEIELTAREPGELSIQVEAKGDAGLHAELAEKVLVRRAALEIVAEGPKIQYVGGSGTYMIHVRNPGNAPAKNIRFIATLPQGMKYLGGIEGLRGSEGKLQWVLESLNPGLEQHYAIKCRFGAAGNARLDLSISADDDLSTAGGFETQVDSAASLTLEVQDPTGPVSLSEETIYEVRVRNRGTKEAEGVEVMSYFSRGIEPTAAEGGPNRIGPGQVAFAPLNTLAPGGEIVFKVHAKAEKPGNHVFRAEVHCKALGTRLISEKNTLYYQDTVPQEAAEATGPVEANRQLAAPEVYRTQRQ